jgi:hypothetical protein
MKKFIVYTIMILFIAGTVYAVGPLIYDAFPPMFKAKSKPFGFELINKSTGRPLDVDTANDVVKLIVRLNEGDTPIFTKTCTYVKKFTHSGVYGTVVAGNSVTGATSAATATIDYIETVSDGELVYMSSITGTFEEGEQVYVTEDVNYFELADYGVWIAVTSLTTTNTNQDIGDYLAYVEWYNASENEDEVLLKSTWKLIQ